MTPEAMTLLITTVIAAIVTGIVSIIAAVSAAVTSIRNGRQILAASQELEKANQKLLEANRKIESANRKVDDVKLATESDAKDKGEKLQKIEILMDGRFTGLLKELAEVRKKVSVLTDQPEDIALAHKAAADAGIALAIKETSESGAGPKVTNGLEKDDKPCI